jgi:hypothetical protein
MALFSDSFWGAKVQGAYANRPATLDYMSLSEFAKLYKGDPDSGIGAEMFSIAIMLNNTMLPSRIWFDNNQVAEDTVDKMFAKTTHWIDWNTGILRLRSGDCNYTTADVVVVERDKLEMPGGPEMSIRGRHKTTRSSAVDDDDDATSSDDEEDHGTCPGLVAADDDEDEGVVTGAVKIDTSARSVTTVSHRSEVVPAISVELVPVEGKHGSSKAACVEPTTLRRASPFVPK